MREEISINESVPLMNVDEMVSLFGKAYSGLIRNGISVKEFPSVMLWGPPGVGKSQGVREVARYIEKNTGRRAVITDVRLLLFNPVDLRGVPTANSDRTLAVWLKPQIFQMDSSEDIVNILFLDEISAAPQSVQAAAYQITLDRKVGEHTLPDNCIIMAAGNRVTDRSVSVKMPKALANRLMHVEIKGSVNSWLAWAERSDVDVRVIEYIKKHKDHLFMFNAESDSLAFATPRSWEMVSSVLKNTGMDMEDAYPFIAGLVGPYVASELITGTEVSETISIENIFNGTETKVPQASDMVYHLINQMTEYARDNITNRAAIACSVHYALRLPRDQASLLFSRYEQLDDGKLKKYLHSLPDYREFLKQKGDEGNGR
ncbi:MAG: ATP-binding protein [Bullifex sp.]